MMQTSESASGVSESMKHISEEFLDRWLFKPDVSYVEQEYDYRLPVVVVLFYVLFVKWLGPMLMSGREPFSLKPILVIYNLIIVSANGYCCYMCAKHCLDYWSIHCRIIDHPNFLPIKEEVFKTAWIYHLSKYVDLIDTVLFVLRKKFSQVSFLHVFHHACVIFITLFPFFDGKYGYYIPYVIMLNSGVHVMTYSYYALSTLGYNLWWKRYLTIAQIAQFVFILAYMGYGLWTGCEQLGGSQLLASAFLCSLFFLFIHYYLTNFSKSKKE